MGVTQIVNNKAYLPVVDPSYDNDLGANKVSSVDASSYDSSTGADKTSDVAPALKEYVSISLLDVSAITAGAGQNVAAYSKHSIFVNVGTSATVLIQGSFDGTNYFTVSETDAGTDISSGLTADGVYTISGKYPFLRANATAVSGALTVDLVSGY